jgi:hypothetical protein
MAGAATQVFSREFDAALARIPGNVRAVILEKGSDKHPTLNAEHPTSNSDSELDVERWALDVER